MTCASELSYDARAQLDNSVAEPGWGAYPECVVRGWFEWHSDYVDSGSVLRDRLSVVQAGIARFLESRDSPVRIVSACAGQGHDVLGALALARRSARVTARLIELDPRNVAAAERAARVAGLDEVEVVCGDASVTDAYVGAVPADLVVMCGIFGNVGDEDVRNTIGHLPQLCASDAVVIWTRHTYPPDLTPSIRRWFQEAGFQEEAFESPGPKTFGVGVHRLVVQPRPLELGTRLFAFTTGYLLLGDDIVAQLDDVRPVDDGYTCRYRTTMASKLLDGNLTHALATQNVPGGRQAVVVQDAAHPDVELRLPNGQRLNEGFSVRLNDDGTAHIRCDLRSPD